MRGVRLLGGTWQKRTVGILALVALFIVGARAWVFREIETGRWRNVSDRPGAPIEARVVCFRDREFITNLQVRFFARGVEVARITPFGSIDMLAECTGGPFAVRSVTLPADRRTARIEFDSGIREWPVVIFGEPEP